MPKWHSYNPWADKLVYLPDLKELSACLDPAKPNYHYSRWINEHSERRLDAYILPQPSGDHSCGIRYGSQGGEYYSPYINKYIAELLLSKYRDAGAP